MHSIDVLLQTRFKTVLTQTTVEMFTVFCLKFQFFSAPSFQAIMHK